MSSNTANTTTTSSSPTQDLANATLDGFNSPIQDLLVQLEELERGQQGWINTLTQEQQNIINMDKDFAEVIGLFSQVPPYIQKLQQMKKDMKDVQDRVKKMHNTATKIKEKRVREEEHRAEKDRQILAQPAPSPSSDSSSASSGSSTTAPAATK